MITFRDLRADEIDCRVARCTEKGAQLLLYKDARADMIILDEQIGPENWQREHYECKGNLFCRVGIKAGNEWIWKADCGAESNTEKEKGEASDSFKRACTNWGIGRELYTSPFIWVKAEDADIEKSARTTANGRPVYESKGRFSVSHMEVKDKKITALEITNKGRVVYSFGMGKAMEEIKSEGTADGWTIKNTCALCGKEVEESYAQATMEKLHKVVCPDCIAAARSRKKNATVKA